MMMMINLAIQHNGRTRFPNDKALVELAKDPRPWVLDSIPITIHTQKVT